MMDFRGAGEPLSKTGFGAATATAEADEAALWAVLSVETSGCGYLPDRRPKVLFERHVFSRLTGHRYDAEDADVSAPAAGGYGAPGAHQYLRLEAAMQLDEAAALKSASWGLGQIMGENHASAGFDDVRDMVSAMVESEDAQLAGMAAFIAGNGMGRALSHCDWASFARLYNGPNYAAHNYDGLLQQFYGRFSAGDLPDLAVRAAQVYLTYRSFAPGNIDGVLGAKTSAAIMAFQASIGVTLTGLVDETLLQQLKGR